MRSSRIRDMMHWPVEDLRRNKKFEEDLLKGLQEVGCGRGMNASLLRRNIKLRSTALAQKRKRSS